MPIAVQVTFDCAQPRIMAEFWAAALRYRPDPGGEGPPVWAAAEPPDGHGPRLYFERVPEPKTAKNRVHLDVNAGAGRTGPERRACVDAEVARLVAAGARTVRVGEDNGEYWVVLLDPEGNEFCVQ